MKDLAVAELELLDRRISEWLAGFAARDGQIVAIDRGGPDEHRWYVRMRGVEKEFTTVWLTLGQRTLRHETYVMPAPEENDAVLYENLLRRNERLTGLHFAIGVEDAVFLRGELPNHAINGVPFFMPAIFAALVMLAIVVACCAIGAVNAAGQRTNEGGRAEFFFLENVPAETPAEPPSKPPEESRPTVF